MKHNRIITGACALIMAFSVTACTSTGSSSASSAQSKSESSVAESSNESTVAESSPVESSIVESSEPESNAAESRSPASAIDTGFYSTMEDFIKSPIIQEQLKKMREAMNGTGISLDNITGDGNKMIYDFIIESEELLAVVNEENLKAGLDAQAPTFQSVVKTLQAVVKVENPVVVIRYLDPAGKEIYTDEFTADGAVGAAQPAVGEQEGAGSAVSSELFDNQFSLDKTVITMPAAVKDFAALGFVIPESKRNFVINPRTMTSGRIESADGEQKVFVSFYNMGSDGVDIGDSMLSSVSIQSRSFPDAKVMLAKGITIGSTMDAVEAAYGEPTKVVDGDSSGKVLREYIKYINPEDSTNFYEFSFEDKVLVGVALYVNEQ